VFGCTTLETGMIYSQEADGLMGLGNGDATGQRDELPGCWGSWAAAGCCAHVEAGERRAAAFRLWNLGTGGMHFPSWCAPPICPR